MNCSNKTSNIIGLNAYSRKRSNIQPSLSYATCFSLTAITSLSDTSTNKDLLPSADEEILSGLPSLRRMSLFLQEQVALDHVTSQNDLCAHLSSGRPPRLGRGRSLAEADARIPSLRSGAKTSLHYSRGKPGRSPETGVFQGNDDGGLAGRRNSDRGLEAYKSPLSSSASH